MQWGVDGKPTWSAPKRIALWGVVAFMLTVRALIWVAMSYALAKGSGAEVGLLVFSIIFGISYAIVLRAALRAN